MKLLRHLWFDLLAAVQFLTRIPVPVLPFSEDTLPRAVKFFPLVGLLVGGLAAGLNFLIAPHLPRLITALLLVTFLIVLTGCFHEDALADTFDGFGGGWSRDQILDILKDSRIGSYGAAALTLGLMARVALLADMAPGQIARYLIAAHVLCRWTTLPLSYFLPPARVEESESAGQGARIARLTTRGSLIVGTSITLAIVVPALGIRAIAPMLLAIAITMASGLYYRSRIQGVTGDCFGATNQLTEIAVLLTGVWMA